MATWFVLALPLSAADPEVDLAELPRFAPVEPTNALATFTVKPGFRLELVAAEPLVRDPIEICFDADGRMFVVEMIDYSERRNEQPHAGRIRRLEDTDGDGRYDRSVVFVDDLPWPTGVVCWRDGVFVAATPDLFFCRDADGDGRAETRERVFTGFGIDFAPFEVTRLNMQAMLNSLRWGLDNRFYGLTGPNGGELTSPFGSNQPPVNVRGRDFAFDPRTFALEAIAGGGQYGMSFNDRGQRFTCNNSDHLRLFHYEARYAARNPALALPPSLQSIAADGPSATVYRHSPEEPWRVIRTRWRVAGLVPGPIEGGGRASGYFTSATGLMVYRGDAWPDSFLGDVFIADCGSNLIHRKQVRRQGFGFTAERPADEAQSEFIACTDTWFRPVQMANAPDGTLYIVDMYREIIEHPWSLPPSLKKHLDLNAGNDRGRIYRVVPDGFQPRRPPRLSTASTRELVATLAHSNAWHRETAARLLYERQDRTQAFPALEALFRESRAPLGRLHALYALLGQDALGPDHILRALEEDPDDRVREHAVRLAGPLLRGSAPAATRDRLGASLARLVADASPAVRYQLAFTLGDWPDPRRLDALVALARRDGSDPWMRAALLTSLAEGAAEVFARLSEVSTAAEADPEMLRDLARVIGAQHRAAELEQVIGRVVQTPDPALALSLTHALAEGLQRARVPLPRERLAAVFTRAGVLAGDTDAGEAVRRQAVALLGQTTFAESGARLLALLVPTETQALQLAALAALGRFTDEAVGGELIARWRSFSPRVRDEALTVMLARPDRALLLLAGLEREVVRRADLNATQVQFLAGHRDPKVREQATRVLTSGPPTERDTVVQALLPALERTGDPARGQRIFAERCASCHRLGGEGYQVGPDIVSVRNAGKEKLLVSIIDPSRELLPQYVAYEIETRDEESLIGFVVDETASHLTLRQAYGQDTVLPRNLITRMTSGGRSIMPDELEAALTLEDIADLLEYLVTAEP